MQPSGSRVARTRPPAKLNLFLELLGKRADGFHEIDTVMVPIDCCDELVVRRSDSEGIRLRSKWLPSEQTMAQRLGVESDPRRREQLLHIPEDDRNLVARSLRRVIECFALSGGFDVELHKKIPAGAGLGGASSDAAAALLCAAKLLQMDASLPQWQMIAAEIGSDVPFFLGNGDSLEAAHATGRGEKIEAISIKSPLSAVVVFPNESLSTASVYAESAIPQKPRSSALIIDALARGSFTDIAAAIHNRLSEPARQIAGRIDEILATLWQSGAKACQLTGSGSACFAITETPEQAELIAGTIRGVLEPGAIVMTTRTVGVPPAITIG